MKKSFKVAGHVFGVVLPDRCPLWDMMGQYGPFEVPVGSGEEIFTLEWVSGLPEREKTPVYTEVPQEEGQSRIELYRMDDGWRFELAPTAHAPVCGFVETDWEYKTARLALVPERRKVLFALNNALMILYAFAWQII